MKHFIFILLFGGGFYNSQGQFIPGTDFYNRNVDMCDSMNKLKTVTFLKNDSLFGLNIFPHGVPVIWDTTYTYRFNFNYKLDLARWLADSAALVNSIPTSTTSLTEGTNKYYTDTRARAALSNGTGISYNSSTGLITNSLPYVVSAVSSVTRPINGTTFTPSSTQPCRVFYTISISCTATIGGTASGGVLFEWSTNGGTTWNSGGELKNSNTVSLAVVLNSVTIQQAVLSDEIPANALCRLTSTTTGNTTISYIRGKEVLY